MALSPNAHFLPQPLEQVALGAFTRRLRFPATKPTVYQSLDTRIDDEWGVTLVFSAQVDHVRRFAILVVPKAFPTRLLEYAGHTAASVLNSRLRREARRAQESRHEH